MRCLKTLKDMKFVHRGVSGKVARAPALVDSTKYDGCMALENHVILPLSICRKCQYAFLFLIRLRASPPSGMT